MAYEIMGFDLPFKTATDLSSNQFHAVYMSADETVALATAAHENTIGILQNKPNSTTTGIAAAVRVSGISKAVLGDTVTIDDKLTPDSSGHLVPATSGEMTIAQALRAGSSGETVPVLLERSRVA